MLPTKRLVLLLIASCVLVSLETVLKLSINDASRVLPVVNYIPDDTFNKAQTPIPLFVRIPKTGSTSLLSYLHTESGMTLLEKLVSKSEWLERFGPQYSKLHREVRKSMLREHAIALFCAHFPASYLETLPDSFTDRKAEIKFASSYQNAWHMQCQHEPLQHLVRSYEQSLDFAAPPKEEVVLRPFTMVREPLARLRSLFHYVEKRCNHRFWAQLFTDQQYETLCSGDYKKWLELIGNENLRKRVTQPKPSSTIVKADDPVRDKYGDEEWLHMSQYRFLHDDIDEATAMVEGDSPAVLVLLNECFEASVRIMEHKFKLPPGSGDQFINSNHYRKNTDKGNLKLNDGDRTTDGNPAESPQTSRRLKEVARIWFEEDYKLFDAAVANFRRQLVLADIDPESLDEQCKAVLSDY